MTLSRSIFSSNSKSMLLMAVGIQRHIEPSIWYPDLEYLVIWVDFSLTHLRAGVVLMYACVHVRNKNF